MCSLLRYLLPPAPRGCRILISLASCLVLIKFIHSPKTIFAICRASLFGVVIVITDFRSMPQKTFYLSKRMSLSISLHIKIHLSCNTCTLFINTLALWDLILTSATDCSLTTTFPLSFRRSNMPSCPFNFVCKSES